MKLSKSVAVSPVLIVILCLSFGVAAQEKKSLFEGIPTLRRCPELENKHLLLHQQLRRSKSCKGSTIERGWTDCIFQVHQTKLLLVGAIGQTIHQRSYGGNGSGFYILSVDPQMNVRTALHLKLGLILRIEAKDMDKETGCLYNTAHITLDARVLKHGEVN